MVCDKGLTLRDLIGTLKMFFDRLGLKKLRFKPAYNPYTEPSMEIFRYQTQQSTAQALLQGFATGCCHTSLLHFMHALCVLLMLCKVYLQ